MTTGTTGVGTVKTEQSNQTFSSNQGGARDLTDQLNQHQKLQKYSNGYVNNLEKLDGTIKIGFAVAMLFLSFRLYSLGRQVTAGNRAYKISCLKAELKADKASLYGTGEISDKNWARTMNRIVSNEMKLSDLERKLERKSESSLSTKV